MSRIIKAEYVSELIERPASRPQPEQPNPGPSRATALLDAAALMRSASERASGIISSAEEAAANILLDTEVRLAEQRQAASEEGYQDGYTRGLEAARQQAAEEAAARVELAIQTLTKATEEIRQLREQIMMAAEPDIIKFAVLIAERIIRGEIAHPERTLDIARSVLAEVEDESRVTLYLPPGVVDSPDEVLHGIAPPGMQVKVEVDPALQTGDIRVETQWGWIDGRGAIRWKRLIEAMERGAEGYVT